MISSGVSLDSYPLSSSEKQCRVVAVVGGVLSCVAVAMVTG